MTKKKAEPAKEAPMPKPKLTDAERHQRFVETAKRVGASEDGADFDKAFARVTRPTALHREADGPKQSDPSISSRETK